MFSLQWKQTNKCLFSAGWPLSQEQTASRVKSVCLKHTCHTGIPRRLSADGSSGREVLCSSAERVPVLAGDQRRQREARGWLGLLTSDRILFPPPKNAAVSSVPHSHFGYPDPSPGCRAAVPRGDTRPAPLRIAGRGATWGTGLARLCHVEQDPGGAPLTGNKNLA